MPESISPHLSAKVPFPRTWAGTVRPRLRFPLRPTLAEALADTGERNQSAGGVHHAHRRTQADRGRCRSRPGQTGGSRLGRRRAWTRWRPLPVRPCSGAWGCGWCTPSDGRRRMFRTPARRGVRPRQGCVNWSTAPWRRPSGGPSTRFRESRSPGTSSWAIRRRSAARLDRRASRGPRPLPGAGRARTAGPGRSGATGGRRRAPVGTGRPLRLRRGAASRRGSHLGARVPSRKRGRPRRTGGPAFRDVRQRPPA